MGYQSIHLDMLGGQDSHQHMYFIPDLPSILHIRAIYDIGSLGFSTVESPRRNPPYMADISFAVVSHVQIYVSITFDVYRIHFASRPTGIVKLNAGLGLMFRSCQSKIRYSAGIMQSTQSTQRNSRQATKSPSIQSTQRNNKLDATNPSIQNTQRKRREEATGPLQAQPHPQPARRS